MGSIFANLGAVSLETPPLVERRSRINSDMSQLQSKARLQYDVVPEPVNNSSKLNFKGL